MPADKLKELRDQRTKILDDLRSLVDATETTGMSAEELERHAKLEAEFTRLDKDIEARTRLADLEERMNKPQPTPDVGGDKPGPTPDLTEERAYARAFRAWMAHGRDGLDVNVRRTLAAGLVDQAETRALGVGVAGAGGYTVPQAFLADLVIRMKAYGAVRRVAKIVNTDGGADMPFPSMDDTANVGRILAENTALTQTDVAFTTKTLKAYMYSSDLILVSYQLLQDSAFDIEQELKDALAQRLGRIMNQHFTTGTGTAQPQGLVTGGTVGVTGATGTTVLFGGTTAAAYGNLISLIHSVDPAYRQSGRCRWMMGDVALGVIRTLADSQGRPLWQPSLLDGTPDNLLGYPVEINPDMAAPAANAKSVAFGDFQAGYMIRDVKSVQMVRLDERYADNLQVGFFGFARADGIVRDANAYKLFAHSAT